MLASITDEGRESLREAMQTYGDGVRTHFLGRLSRPQITAMGENCRRISAGLKSGDAARPRSAASRPLSLSAVAWQSGLMHSP